MVQKINDIFQNSEYTDGSFVAKLMELNVDNGWELDIKADDPLIVALDALSLLSSPALLANIMNKLREIGLPLADDAAVSDIYNLFHVDKAYVKDIVDASEEQDWDLPINELQDWDTVLVALKSLIKNNLNIILTKLESIGLPVTSESTLTDVLSLSNVADSYIEGIVQANTDNNWGLTISTSSSWSEILTALGLISNNDLTAINNKLIDLGYPLTPESTIDDILALDPILSDGDYVGDVALINEEEGWLSPFDGNSTWAEVLIELRKLNVIPPEIFPGLAHYDFSHKEILWQDAERTVPVVNVGDPVLGLTDLTLNYSDGFISPNGSTSYYREDENGRGYLELGANSSIIVTDLIGQQKVIHFQIPDVGDTHVTDDSFSVDGASLHLARIAFYEAKEDIQSYSNLYATGTTTSLANVFKGRVSFNENINNWNMASIEDVSYMLAGCVIYNQPMGSWNTFNIKTIEGVLQNAAVFNQDLNSWNVLNVTNANYAFQNAYLFNKDLNYWNTASFETAIGMLQNALVFKGNISTWILSALRDASFMLDGALVFNGDLSSWRAPLLENMEAMFRNAKLFTSDLNEWPVNFVENMREAFYGAESFNSNLYDWVTDALLYMERIFKNAYSFNGPINSWNVLGVISLESILENARSFNQAMDLWKVQNVMNMDKMVKGTLIFDRDLSGWEVDQKPTHVSFGVESILQFKHYPLFNGALISIPMANIGQAVLRPGTILYDAYDQPIADLIDAVGGLYDTEVYSELRAFLKSDYLPYMETPEGSPYPWKIVADFTG